MIKRLDVVAAALIDRDGRVLMAERPEGKSLAGLWEFPGGKITQGECPEAAIVRELKEELEIETDQSCMAPLGFYSGPLQGQENSENIHLLMLMFICRKWDGLPRGCEGQRLKWIKPENLSSLQMPIADRPLAAQLREILCPTA